MKYMGSKNRLAKEILPIILKNRTPEQCYVEPFIGGANMLDKVSGKRVGNDIHYYLIEMYKALQRGWLPPKLITEDMYAEIKQCKDNYDPALVGYVGFSLSFGGKWFGGYRRDVAGTKGCIKNMTTQSIRSYNSIVTQRDLLLDVTFSNMNYWEIELEPNSIVYCDPPYENTTKYNSEFDHTKFWEWVRTISNDGHTVFVSEYSAPDDFICLWSKDISTTLSTQDNKNSTEKLFTYGNPKLLQANTLNENELINMFFEF
jgi:DNA adenine methylase